MCSKAASYRSTPLSFRIISPFNLSATYFPGACFETQNYPDAINHADFPNCTLGPREQYFHRVTYRFTNDGREEPDLAL